MQVHNAGRTAGVSSSATVSDPFAGLGDLPGLGHVGPDIDCDGRVVVTAPVRVPMTSLVEFPPLSKRLWLVYPSSLLLQPLTPDIDATCRPLSQRTATRIDVAGPSDGASGTGGTQEGAQSTEAKAPSTRKRKRDPQEPALAFADPRDGLSLARPDSHNLEDVVAAMARQLVRQDVAGRTPEMVANDAHGLGLDLGRRLGGQSMAQSLCERVLRTLLQLTLPPSQSASPESGGAGPGIGPLEREGVGRLGNLLRGFRCAFPASSSEVHRHFMQVLVKEAARLSLDPLHMPGHAGLQVTDYSRRSGPLELAGWTLGLGQENVGFLRGFLASLLHHLMRSCLPSASAADRAWHAQCLLASLAWLPPKMQPLRESDLSTLIQTAAAAARDFEIDAGAVGIGLTRALAGVRGAALDVHVLTIFGLNLRADSDVAILGAMAAAYLPESTGQPEAFLSLLEKVPHLHPAVAGRLAYRLALAEGRAGLWNPSEAVTSETCRLRQCIARMGHWDPARQRAVLHGLLGAVPHLVDSVAGFAQLDRQLRNTLDILCLASHALRHTVVDVLEVVRDPQHVFAMARDSQRLRWAPLHIGQVLSMKLAPSHQFLSDVVRFLLSEKAQGLGGLHLLLRVTTDHPATVTPLRLPKVRALLLAGLEPQAQPGSRRPATSAPQAVSLSGTIKGLQSIYGYLAPRHKLDLATEVAALTTSSVAAQLQPVLDTLSQLGERPEASKALPATRQANPPAS